MINLTLDIDCNNWVYIHRDGQNIFTYILEAILFILCPSLYNVYIYTA